MKNIIIRGLLILVTISAVAFFWSDIKDVVASNPKKNKSTPKENAPASSGVNIDKKWELPGDLREISGLSYIDTDRFACVQDETGIVYIYNTATSSIEREIKFAGAGDFEGLAVVGNRAWVVRSDGHLYEVNMEGGAKPLVNEYDTHLSADHNIEGLCYDPKNKRLLIALKDGEPGVSDYKGIYGFDLATKKMPEQPVVKIDMKNDMLQTGSKKKKGPFMPSSIAIHPETGDFYLTDGRSSKLLVMSDGGEIKKVYQLDKNDFAQPEGITFKPSGELYISNEGPKEPANILKIGIE